ncbi:hypothetical protein [Dongia sedimenti]|uniref:Uncharacterized protein n=1 Tax=Dongia sedimenti TaxID=3064282 RepID=A0ABU0YS41_9PROT|nr:hypothetical protein [Rhodospirillaceae bacterium R-7]
MSDFRHQFRLWALGTLVIMVTLGSLTGVLLRQWRDGLDADQSGSAMAVAACFLLLGLIAVWFRNGHRLWTAAKAR